MNRIRSAALVTAAALSALVPAALSQAAGGPSGPGTSYLQDPSGGGQAMKSAWTEGDRHKLSGQFRFHPGMDYKLKDKPGPSAAPEWAGKTPDLDTLVYRPEFVFSYEVATSAILKKGITEKKGRHPVTLHAVLRDPKGAEVARFHEPKPDRAATGEKTVPLGRTVGCDTGTYTVQWQIARTGGAGDAASVGGELRWNSSCTSFRDALSH
jgi:hypothetical protein